MAYVVEVTIDPRWQVALEWDAPAVRGPTAADYSRNPRSIDPNDIPRRGVFDTNRIAVPDFVTVFAWMALSKRVRDHIEAIEPGRNEYFPFELARKKSKKPLMGPDGNLLTDPYYLLNVTTRIDAVLIDRSPIKPIDPIAKLVYPQFGKLSEIILDRYMIAGHHVWQGTKHLRGKVMFSDELGEWIIRNKMKALEMTHLREA